MVNMAPYTIKDKNDRSHTPYMIKISGKNDIVDQQRGFIEVKPGYHLVVRILPKVVDASIDLEQD